MHPSAPSPCSARRRYAAAVSFAIPLPSAGPVRLDLFDVSGRRVRTLHDGILPAGDQVLSWDGILQSGDAAPAGIYFPRTRWRNQSQSTQIVLLRR
ncbi:MAG: hypothetical protein IT349_05455 [Candidatus Eisenbacteria bacterium]|nr:hypothetical protein [Candidatus Eisenbacteria bacterium]